MRTPLLLIVTLVLWLPTASLAQDERFRGMYSGQEFDFLLAKPPEVTIQCVDAQNISYPTIQRGDNRCTAHVGSPLTVYSGAVNAYYNFGLPYRKVRTHLLKPEYEKGISNLNGWTELDSRGVAEAAISVRSPKQETDYSGLVLSLLGAALKNAPLPISYFAQQRGLAVPLAPPDWDSVRRAGDKFVEVIHDRQKESLELEGVAVRVWICNSRVCSPPGQSSIKAR